MKLWSLLVLLVGCNFWGISQECDLAASKKAQSDLNQSFLTDSVSPLTKEDFSQFKGLKFFKPNTKYCVRANFTRTAHELPFLMKTTTDRLPEYVKFGEVVFEIDGERFQLNVYQNTSLSKKAGYEDYLFLPFKDETNGNSTYYGGRYLDLRIPKSDEIILDFNRAYNPYCAYNPKYSCPIVPRENQLSTRIRAGVKKYH